MAVLKNFNAVIIIVGNEILSGKTLDSNSAFIAEALHTIGISVIRKITVQDEAISIKSAVKEALEYSSLVICTGGLGPTSDDITKNAVAEYFGMEIIVDSEQLKIVEKKFKNAGYLKMPETNISQAEVPKGAVILPNPRGTAPGLLLKSDDNKFFMLPGVPLEMEALMLENVIPHVKSKLADNKIIIIRSIRIIGIGESKLVELIEPDLNIPSNIELAYLPKGFMVDIRLTGSGKDISRINDNISKIEKSICEKLPDNIYGFDSDTLESVIGRLLSAQKKTVAVAESCTGGLLGDRITSTPGSSEYFLEGIITYSNEAKMKYLGIRQETLERFGAVSSETAMEMANGIRIRSGASVGISITGIAGPGGGTAEKPVGLVFIGISDENGTIVEKLLPKYKRDRQWIKLRSTYVALDCLRKRLLGKLQEIQV